ncbi:MULTISPECIES: DUF29 family protein [Planktothrix]|jgi:hypothetical protein|uniref:DUF29 family protein n=4 Tax=Planktothrix TaxID=54304 RepID=A0A073CPG8_PLAA1|nr:MULTISPECIES: DUF29 family protein [Planktothrix]MCF3608184.1 DUF29 domain-containing protein [Planktothrix agardhii 1033]CAD5915946.1 hypothetical protein NO108_00722 [Planktothrix rubescens]BBD54789.1 hypothetical protein NIES204_20850 [Planktothrix agardhii NIES-204]KEI65875.1 hypothetical protein A19Y_0705 [Planktothrix agardhii NIVA-CYA 126/8]MBG0747299.1 DUF29 family protein [Planktothrix agardhii KL2]
MIQELADLKASLLEGRYQDALTLVEQLDGMSRQAKIDAIESQLVRMLIHLVKNQLEQRLTNSWAASIRGALVEIKRLNLQDNRISTYIKQNEWQSLMEDALESAISDASVEVFQGNCTPFQLSEMVDREAVISVGDSLINLTYRFSKKELPNIVNQALIQLPGGIAWGTGN